MSLIADGEEITKAKIALIYNGLAERYEAAGSPLDTVYNSALATSGAWVEQVKFADGTLSNLVDACQGISGAFCDANGDGITFSDSPPAAGEVPDRRRYNAAYDRIQALRHFVYYPDSFNDVNKGVHNDFATPAQLAAAKSDFLSATESAGGGGLAMGGSSSYLGDFAPGFIPPDPPPPPDPRYQYSIFGFRQQFSYTIPFGTCTGRLFLHAALAGFPARFRFNGGSPVDVHGPASVDMDCGGGLDVICNALPYEDATALAGLNLAAGFDMGVGASGALSDFRLVVTPAWIY